MNDKEKEELEKSLQDITKTTTQEDAIKQLKGLKRYHQDMLDQYRLYLSPEVIFFAEATVDIINNTLLGYRKQPDPPEDKVEAVAKWRVSSNDKEFERMCNDSLDCLTDGLKSLIESKEEG